ncbi:MAG: class I SAM-dependent methyltransferase [Candidatus Binatus sp.]|uniref:class I SAM-dependent DNA methyltransferase n=1 Tax=Candidatus Binatus sp. TaxID=2811406 RepID=UPI0027205000|nr:class I SAM-dependent methyltransferase [Candidatus Binatus sp.]MDO8434060.1 class I SAM-dependent methyltransferase [Candidatus Binatus sp.]
MFTKSAEFYDAIYSWKDYAKEAQLLLEFIARHRKSTGNRLLDVACGTGAHIAFLKDAFSIEGLDLDDNMLAIARSKHPELVFHHGDMIDFDLPDKFDVVVCLFSAIGYVRKPALLNKAIANMARHLVPGGVLIVEPWLTPEKVEGGKRPPVHSMFVDRPGLKIARLNETLITNGIFRSNFHYLIGQGQRIYYRRERHELGLFTHEQYLDAFRNAGLEVHHDEQGLMGRGLYVGVRAS